MDDQGLTFTKPELTFATIVSTPTLSSWSQAYNAGTLFAVLSLTKDADDTTATTHELNALGKDVFETLEQEYFTLETKNLDSIKKAIETTYEKIPHNLSFCFVVAAIPPRMEEKKSADLVYVYSVGNGRVLMKREEKIGNLFHPRNEFVAGSAFLHNNDVLILQTHQFSALVSDSVLLSALSLSTPSDMAENLAPKIHQTEDGGACAVIFSYRTPSSDIPFPSPVVDKQPPPQEEIPSSTRTSPLSLISMQLLSFVSSIKNLQKLPNLRSKKMFLLASIGICLFLIISIFTTVRNRQDAKIKAVFQKTYDAAQKKYDEGQNLAPLNKNLARDTFSQAGKILTDAKPNFGKDSEEEKQINVLLEKVTTQLSSLSGATPAKPTPVDPNNSLLLSYELHNTSVTFITQDTSTLYALTENDISTINKKTKKAEKIIKNENDVLKNAKGIGVYSGNIYVLNKKTGQIVKYVPTDSGYSPSNYLTQPADFSSSQSLTVDGSIWIVYKNGEIRKWTRGKSDSYTISGLDKPLANPSDIFTDQDTTSLYVLDNGNGRIVVLGKDGSYTAQYQADILKTAKDFEVLEKDKKIFVLSSGKIWQIDLK